MIRDKLGTKKAAQELKGQYGGYFVEILPLKYYFNEHPLAISIIGVKKSDKTYTILKERLLIK